MAIKRLCSMVVVATLVLMGPAVLERSVIAQEPGPPQMRAQLSRMPSLEQNVWPADFNRDGITDLVAGRRDGEILVVFGHGDGTFTAEQAIATGYLRPIPGDVDGDGDADVIVNGAVIPGNGNGTFGPPVASAVETSAVSNQVHDFNGDGHLDLARLNGAAVTIYPGNGDLTFGPSVRLSAPPGGETFSLAVGDINSDGRPDIGVATASWVDLFVNQGGLIYSHSRLTMGQLVLGLTFWDLNGDGVLDTIVSSGTRTPSATPIWVSGFVHVLLGNGDGTFQDPLTFVTNNGPRTAVAGDFNGDGLPDIATGNLSRGRDSCDSGHLWDSISLLPGLGNGQLGPPTSYALGNDSTPGSVDVSVYRNRHDLLNTSDLNGDGHTDLIASPGAILLATEPAENNIPVVDAGPSQTLPTSETHHLRGSATDADNDWLTFRWTDQTGAVVGTVPQPCFSGSQFPGVQTFTLTVTDGHGGVATDSVTHHIQPSFLPPTTWSGNAIGDMTLRGETIVAESSVFVRGAGADIWGTADEFQFAHQALSGDFEITARVASVENIHPWTKAGIMIRDGLSSSARHAFLFATPTATNGVAFQRRVNTGELTVHTSGPAISPPAWLQLRREGDVVSAFVRESESAPWSLVGTEMLGGLPSGVRVGFAVTSHDGDAFAIATFDNVTVTPLGSSLPSGWNSTDVGATGMPGSVVSDGSSFTVQGSGADIWGTTDAFQFAYRRLTGSGAIVARATDLAGPHAWSKAGLMIRDSLDPSSAHHFLLLSEAQGVAYQRRPNHGELTLHTGLGEAPVAPWFAISWSPSGPIRLLYSADGIAWTPVATTSFPSQDGEVYLGLAVTSHESNQLATATFDNVAVSWGIGVTDLDIGNVGVAGSALFDGRRHVVSGSGADVWRSVDAFHYSFQTLPANGGILAAVTAFDAPHEWSKAGLMIRASTDPSASHAFVLVSRDHGIAFQRRTLAGGVTTHTDDGGRPALVPWLMLVRAGPVIAASVSYDGVVWHDLGADVFPEMGSGPVLVGLAVTSHDNAAVATATFEHVIEE